MILFLIRQYSPYMDEIHEFTNKMQIINLKEEVKKISKIVNGNVLKNISEKVRIFHNIK